MSFEYNALVAEGDVTGTGNLHEKWWTTSLWPSFTSIIFTAKSIIVFVIEMLLSIFLKDWKMFEIVEPFPDSSSTHLKYCRFRVNSSKRNRCNLSKTIFVVALSPQECRCFWETNQQPTMNVNSIISLFFFSNLYFIVWQIKGLRTSW